MNITVTVEKDDMLLWAKHKNYKPSSVDLTKVEQAAEFLAADVKSHIDKYKNKEARRALVKADTAVTASGL